MIQRSMGDGNQPMPLPDRQTDRERDKETDRKKGRQRERQRGRQTDKQASPFIFKEDCRRHSNFGPEVDRPL